MGEVEFLELPEEEKKPPSPGEAPVGLRGSRGGHPDAGVQLNLKGGAATMPPLDSGHV